MVTKIRARLPHTLNEEQSAKQDHRRMQSSVLPPARRLMLLTNQTNSKFKQLPCGCGLAWLLMMKGRHLEFTGMRQNWSALLLEDTIIGNPSISSTIWCLYNGVV